MLAGRLRGMGRRAEMEPTYVHPQYALVQLIHVALAIAGSLVAISEPPSGFALVLFAATSMYLDLNTRFYLVRCLLFRRASQNVVSPGATPRRPVRLILVAHYDAARTGYVFGERCAAACPPPLRARPRAARAVPADLLGRDRSRCCRSSALRMAGIDASWVAIAAAVPDGAADRRRLPADRHRALARSFPAPTTTPRASPPSSRPPSSCARRAPEPRRLGRAPRRRGVARRGHARLRPGPPATSSTGSAPSFVNVDSVSYGDGPLRGQRGGGDQLPDGPRAGRALRGTRGRRARRAEPRQAPALALEHRRTAGRASAASARSRSSASTTACRRPGTTPRGHAGQRRRRGDGAGDRVRRRAGAAARPRRRP